MTHPVALCDRPVCRRAFTKRTAWQRYCTRLCGDAERHQRAWRRRQAAKAHA